MYEQKQLFDFMLDRVKEIGRERGLEQPQAFGRWFVELYFEDPQNIYVSDGTRDGKVDIFFQRIVNDNVEHVVLNTKFTTKYNVGAPNSFYDEITRFWQAFAHKPRRAKWLATVRPELRNRYKKLLEHYDADRAHLMFVTNHKKNPGQYETISSDDVQVFHLEDVLQFMADYIEGAMPRTRPLLLTGISGILSPDRRDTSVPTTIVFARLTDFIKYMENDPYDILFARNVRLSLGNVPVNKEIAATFAEGPEEFAFSNNGITMICERHRHDPGSQELMIDNPRIVNGSQTLHSIRDVENPSTKARVMVRIIELPPLSARELPSQRAKRKGIINKISIRSNRQNPIKKWDLVSNDDFQQELARFFREKQLYYERRAREWSQRRTELRSVAVDRGPGIKGLAQLMASYYWDKKQVGPARAKVSVSELFDEKAYGIIQGTSPELAYQIYLLGKILDDAFKLLALRKRYIRNLGGHSKFTLFSLVVRALQAAGSRWGHGQFTTWLETQAEGKRKPWAKMVKPSIDHIYGFYRREAVAYRKTEGKELTFNNYFKSERYVGRIFSAPVPRELMRLGGMVLGRRQAA